MVKKAKEIADFIGVSIKSLNINYAKNFVVYKDFRIIDGYDRDWLDEKFNEHCGGLMKDFFPEFTLQNFLSRPRQKKSTINMPYQGN
ncbi:hypothetical protein ACFLRM_01615 [Acidobacteriota bacterium]